MENGEKIALILIGVLIFGFIVWLAAHRLFWVVVFGLFSFATLFTVIASVIHFQIFAAVGFFVLFLILGGITNWIGEGL